MAKTVELHSDGGGKVEAVPNVLFYAKAVAQFLVRIWRRPGTEMEVVPQWFNGMPGVLIYEAGQLATALTVAIDDGRIHRIYAVRNPDKLVAFKNTSTTML